MGKQLDEVTHLQLPDLLFILLKHISKEGLAFQLAALAAQGNRGHAPFLQLHCLFQRALHEQSDALSVLFSHPIWKENGRPRKHHKCQS